MSRAALLLEESVRTLEQRLTKLWSKAWANSWSSFIPWRYHGARVICTYQYLSLPNTPDISDLSDISDISAWWISMNILSYRRISGNLVIYHALTSSHEFTWHIYDAFGKTQESICSFELAAPEARNSTWDCLPNCLQSRRWGDAESRSVQSGHFFLTCKGK